MIPMQNQLRQSTRPAKGGGAVPLARVLARG